MPSAKMPLQFQNLTTIPLSDDERTSQTITPENMAKAVVALHRDGIVCLSNAVEIEHVEKLGTLLSEESEILKNLPTTHFSKVNPSNHKPSE